MKFKKSLSAVGVFLILSGNASALQLSGGATNDNPPNQDSWFDITVLSARVVPNLTLKDLDKVENCQKISESNVMYGRTNHFVESFDCSNYIGPRLGGTSVKQFPTWNFDNHNLTSTHLMVNTQVVEIFTVVPEDRLSTADYLGFSESWLGGRVNLFRAIGPSGQTREVNKVKLKDGRTGIVHKWVAPFSPNGSTTAGILKSFPFKPVLVRVEGDTQNRYWDKLIGVGMGKDYLITNNVYSQEKRDYIIKEPNSYDRSKELLAE